MLVNSFPMVDPQAYTVQMTRSEVLYEKSSMAREGRRVHLYMATTVALIDQLLSKVTVRTGSTHTDPIPRATQSATFLRIFNCSFQSTTAGYTAKYKSVTAEKPDHVSVPPPFTPRP